VLVSLEMIFPNGIIHYLAGGICIGLATSLIFIFTGNVAGMSSFFSSTLSWFSRLPFFQQDRLLNSRVWRLYLAIGLVIGGAVYWFGPGPGVGWQTGVPLWQLALGGFIAGYGARLGSGCTSGHGICGMASLQWRSLISVLIFMACAFFTANLVAHVGGGL